MAKKSDGEESETETVEEKQNDMNVQIEKDALETIQNQSTLMEKLQPESNRFSFFKYLRRDKQQQERSGIQEVSSIPASAPSDTGRDE